MSIQAHINRIRSNIAAAFSAVADKGGTVPQSNISDNLADAIKSIPTGLTIQKETGSFVTGEDGTFGVQLSFVPNCIYIYHPDAPRDYVAYVAGQDGSRAVMFGDIFGGLIEIWIGVQDSAFGGKIYLYSWDFDKQVGAGIALNYIAYRTICGGQ